MASRKAKPIEKIKTMLLRPRELFTKELNEIIHAAEEFYSSVILNYQQLSELNKKVADWSHANKELLKRAFNTPDNEYYKDYSRINQAAGLGEYFSRVNTETFSYKVDLAKQCVQNYITFLTRLVASLPLIDDNSSNSTYNTKEKTFYNTGFIIHGHNQELKYEVARFIENDLKKNAIILHEKPNKGRTIIEKFMDYSKVDFAVALWTADDIGNAKINNRLNDRARQNVVFETGFFIGKIGRENVIVLHETGVEIPSDYSGVIFIPFDGNWKDDLRKDIEAIYQLDS